MSFSLDEPAHAQWVPAAMLIEEVGAGEDGMHQVAQKLRTTT